MIRKIQNGRYRIDFRDSQGRRYRKLYDTRKEADAALAEVKTQIRQGDFLAPKQIPTFREAAETWFTGKIDRRPATLATWRNHLDRHLLPQFGDLRLDRIDTAAVERFRAELRQALGPRTVRDNLATLSAVFKTAIRHRHIRVNPVDAAERHYVASPELTGADELQTQDERNRPVREEEILNPAEIRRLIAAARPGYYRTLFALAAGSGMRWGELFALRWAEVEFDTDESGRGRVHVRRALSWAKGPGDRAPRPRFFPPKTKAGVRDISIPRGMVIALKAWKLQSLPNELDLVFPSPSGQPARRDTTFNELRRALRGAGLRSVRFHSLRHSYASALIMGGASVTEVQKLLGHANPTITLSVYAHWFRGLESGATDRLGAALFGEDGPFLDTGQLA